MGMRMTGRGWIGAAVLGASLAACSPEPAADPPKPQTAAPIQVELHRVAARGQAGTLRASGLVAFKSETALSFSAAGVIDSLNVDDGAQVKAGQLLATLRRTSVGADAAEAEVVKRTAQQTYDRVTRLFAAGAASQADVDAARLGLERTRDSVSIIAPASGVILRRDVDRGQTVTAGQSVFQLGEARTGVIVRAQLSSIDVSRVKAGDAATITIPGRDVRAGQVTQISPKMAAGMGSFEVEVRFDNGVELRSGEVAEVQIATSDAQPTADATSYLIPAIALIDARADQGIVYVVDESGRAKRRAVSTEGVIDGGVVVTGGLKPGEAVIARGASMVRDGDIVAVSVGQD